MSTAKRPVDLLTGWPSPSLLPPAQLEAAAHTVLSNPDLTREALRYGEDEGYLPLREAIAGWLTKFYEPKETISYDRICISGGASQNIACVLQTFTDPVYTRNVWMVAPTYFRCCRIIDDSGFGGRMKGVPEDEEGIDIDYLASFIELSENKAIDEGNLEPKLKTKYPWREHTYKHIIYAVPTFANPSGKVMSLRRREQLVRIARKYDALIITDDVYDMLQWPAATSTDKSVMAKSAMPRIVDVDRYLDGGPTSEWGNAMSNGSFSKIVGPGCRTGWAEASPKLAWGLSQCGSSRSGGAPSHLVACMIHQMIITGDLDEHITGKLLPAYAKRYRRMMQAVQTRLFPLGVTVPQPDKEVAGGYFIWLTLPKELDGEEIRRRAQEEEELTICSGAQSRVQGDEADEAKQFNHNLRLCFAYADFDVLDEGVERLARVVKASLKK
ncbi:Valine--pyruvate aminotransferase [Knufia obscura]|uniref:Valine--pyruvate aminotransferase n=2 Tax=Knufia TaxID=430999 RepID=A0AAN8ECU1_9EURO|nr:Valine--pyruvate aminotransferase [Knufia obscura]KAK5952524.1 Valine--pyruvate aminotransferase [Knufia fluminis]